MEHKKYLEYLKNNDPITYYELTSNPTGSDSTDSYVGCILMGIILLVIVTILIMVL